VTTTDFWDRHIFVLLGSDAIHRGLHGALVARLRAEGFPPVAATMLTVHPELIDDLYADLIAGQWQTWRYRLVDAVLALGPAMALICRYSGHAGDRDPHELMAERKGYQHPERALPGTLRRDFGAVNSIVGLMHSSDGPAESRREAAIFGLGPVAVRAGPGCGAQLDYLCRLTTPHTPERRDFDQVLAAVRTRIVAAAWDQLSDDVRAGIRAAFPDASGLGAAGAGDVLAGLLADQLPADLRAVLSCEFEPSERERTRMGTVQDVLRRWGVTLDPWERLVLESSLHFPPLRASRAAGS
jgi:nucleoside diphosphate kinase